MSKKSFYLNNYEIIEKVFCCFLLLQLKTMFLAFSWHKKLFLLLIFFLVRSFFIKTHDMNDLWIFKWHQTFALLTFFLILTNMWCVVHPSSMTAILLLYEKNVAPYNFKLSFKKGGRNTKQEIARRNFVVYGNVSYENVTMSHFTVAVA